MKKVYGLLLIIATLLLLTACVDTGNEIIDDEHKHEPIVFEETEFYLLEDTVSAYTIVYPEAADEMIRNNAVSELKFFFKQATDFDLPAISDKNLTYEVGQKYISIGHTSLLETSDIEIDPDLGESGVQIITKDESVFLFGNTRFGTLYSVYVFLEHQLNYRSYAIDEIGLDRDLESLKLLDFKLIQLPTFDYRVGSIGELWNNATFARRMKMHTNDDVWIKLGGLAYHNFFATVPPSQYKADHPEWYSEDGRQLCLLADPEGLKAVVVEQMKKYITANPSANVLSFTQEDVNLWCECEVSTALKDHYGTNAAEMIIFLNMVGADIEAWLAVEEPGREVTILMFAYHRTEEAPARFDETLQKYVPIDDEVILRDNVGVLYAPIFSEHYYDYYHESNINTSETMKKWSALTDNVYLWSYGTYFFDYLIPFDSLNSIQGKYKFAQEHGTKYVFDQGTYNQSIGTDWFRLKQFIMAELQWDVNKDMDQLINEFFENYFKDASEHMLKYLDSYRTWHAYIAVEEGLMGQVVQPGVLQRKHFPQGLLNEWLGYIDDAYASISYLEKSDPALYKLLKDRITLESISPRYMMIELYNVFFSPEENAQMLSSLKADTLMLGMAQQSEFNTLTEYFNKK